MEVGWSQNTNKASLPFFKQNTTHKILGFLRWCGCGCRGIRSTAERAFLLFKSLQLAQQLRDALVQLLEWAGRPDHDSGVIMGGLLIEG